MFSKHVDDAPSAREFLEQAKQLFLWGTASERTVPPWKGTGDQGEESA